MSSASVDYTKKELPKNLLPAALLMLAVGLVVMIAAYFLDAERAAFNNVWILTFITSLGLGSLFWIAVEYIVGAVWSTPFRRIAEIITYLLVLAAIILIPAYLSSHSVFHWAHLDVVEHDPMLKAKTSYLNTSFFGIRQIVFFAIWLLFMFLFTRLSFKQDFTGVQSITSRLIKTSAVFLPIFALSITFFAFDWLMSLEPHWFSTIFGVYYFSGTVLAAMAAITFTSVKLYEKGYLIKKLSRDNFYSMGALLFGFVNFWAYIAFSQFLLIWYANLPEETVWFLQRWEGSWMFLSIGLIFVHFVVPYFGLLSQPSKMNLGRLKFMSLWILFAHLYDLYWMIFPTYSGEGFVFSWIEIGAIIFIIGSVISVFVFIARNKNLIPVGDPKLKRGIDFRL